MNINNVIKYLSRTALSSAAFILAPLVAPAQTSNFGLGFDAATRDVLPFNAVLSGDGSTAYFEGYAPGGAANYRFTEAGGLNLITDPSIGFFIDNRQFATSFDGSYALAKEDFLVRFGEDHSIAEEIAISGKPFIGSPRFVGSGSDFVTSGFFPVQVERFEVVEVPAGTKTVESTSTFVPTPIQDDVEPSVRNLGVNASGEVVGFFQSTYSSQPSNPAGFYFINEDGLVREVPLDLSALGLTGFQQFSVFEDNLGTDGSFALVDLFDGSGDYRLAKVDLSTGAAIDVLGGLPGDFNQQVNALFGTSFDGSGDFFEEPISGLNTVDEAGNLIGDLRRLDFVFPSGIEPGLFVVTEQGTGDVISFEDYLRLRSAGDADVAALLDAVEVEDILSTSADGNTLLLSGVDAGGDYDFFLLNIASGSVTILPSTLDLINNPQIRQFLASGGANNELVTALQGATNAQIAEFGRGLSSVMPAAVGIVMNNALNHTFNLNSRFDMLHRETLTGLGAERERNGFGVYAFTTILDRDYESNVSGVTGQTDSYGGMLVGDWKIKDGFFAGFGLGYKEDETDFNTGAELEGDTFNLSGYFSYQVSEQFFIDGLLQYVDVDMDSTRLSLSRLTASPEASAYGTELRGSYYFDFELVSLALKGSLSYNRLDFDGYTESGGLGAATVESFEVDSFRSSLGVHAQHRAELADRALVLGAQIEWLHEFIDENEQIGASAAGASFNTETDNPDEDSGLVTLSAIYYFSDHWTGNVEYAVNFGDDVNEDNLLRLGLSYEF